MKASIKAVCEEVLRRVTPTPIERATVLDVAEKVRSRVAAEAQRAGLEATVEIGGSVAKDTWLRGEGDVDIFMLVPPSLGREELVKVGLEVAKRAVEEWGWRERYAEHPYLEASVESTRINIVPCYKVRKGEWLSAADRTPFHTEYVRQRLSKRDLRGEMRLLKRFMKGIETYGAEIRVGGFSGYLCELLILNYDSFEATLSTAANWRRGQIIDIANYYDGRFEEVRILFDAPFIVIDPIDKNRNVAAAVTAERFAEFAAASQRFSERPSLNFFYPAETLPIDSSGLLDRMRARGTDFIFLAFTQRGIVPDVLWGQLYKTLRSLRRLLEQYDFKVIRSSAWSDEESLHILMFELEIANLPLSKRHIGPPAPSKESQNFLEKHSGAEDTSSGPWVEDGRWVVEKRRRHTRADQLLRTMLASGGQEIGVASIVKEGVKNGLQVLRNDQILELYAAKIEFAKLLIDLLDGRPIWLR